MSRGPGIIERKIKDYLEKEDGCEGVKKLTWYVFGHEKSGDPVTESEYQSVCRAVRSLKRKGLVETRKYKRREESNKWSKQRKKYRDLAFLRRSETYLSHYKSNWYLIIYLVNDDF